MINLTINVMCCDNVEQFPFDDYDDDDVDDHDC